MKNSTQRILERQGYHIAVLAVLVGLFWWTAGVEPFRGGAFLGIPTPTWLLVAFLVPTVHQVVLTVWWRTRLERDTSKPARRAEFIGYLVFFFVLFVGRMATIVPLAISNAGAIAVGPPIRVAVAVLFFVPSAYLFYSVFAYFGLVRAAGADHFDPAYQTKPFVRRGIFRFTSNGMYTYGLLVLWIPGIVLASPAAILVAAFQHVYIWVHYFCTELPDMRRIYGRAATDTEHGA